MTLPERLIPAVLDVEQYKKEEFCYQRPDTKTQPIEPNVIYRDETSKQIKFALFPKAIEIGAYLKALEALRDANWSVGCRTANGQVLFGKKITVGWIQTLAYHMNYPYMLTMNTLEQPQLMAAIFPLLLNMDKVLFEQMEEYWKFVADFTAPKVTKDELIFPVVKRSKAEPLNTSRIADPALRRTVEDIAVDIECYTIRGTPFSSVELNRNIVFKAHEDGSNVEGTLVCIAALGSFVGGRLVFPRYGYSAELGPYDLLVCDNNHELHGNLGPIVGERFSVVAFLHNSVCGRADQDSVQNEPAVWDCHAGKKYPSDAEYVGCRVLSRKGDVIREGTDFGNGTNPLVSHKGAVHSEKEFRARATEKLKDPKFRAKADRLRGKHLLCWCVQDGPNRAEFCHARVWLDLINYSREQWASTESPSEQRRNFDWGYYEPHFLSKEEADALFEMAETQPRFRPVIKRSGYPLRRCASTCWSVRDRNDDSVAMVPLSEAPPEILSLQRKLSEVAGKDVNYFSLQAYENEKDHIDWHQHREDKCRDARVFIISLGERRSFEVDKLCPECLLCDNCNHSRCHPDSPPCSNRSKCKAAKKHRATCAVRKSTKTVLLPKHGSLIALTSEANDWYEHAVLDDTESKGLRISINTKCIPPEDAGEGYVPRELRRVGRFVQKQSGS
jgi:hypothetical protein